MKNQEFLQQLNEYVGAVFDHEQVFLLEFFSEFAGCKINSFCMTRNERCYISLTNQKTGNEYIAAIDTNRFMEWFDALPK